MGRFVDLWKMWWNYKKRWGKNTQNFLLFMAQWR